MHVLVTGASDGIGAATARAFAVHGAAVTLVARRRDLLDEVASEVDAAGGRGFVVTADVGIAGRVRDAVAAAAGRFGPIDVLVNNAGMPGGGSFSAVPLEQIERVTSVNLLGPIWATHAVLPSMVERGRGTIVNVASIAGRLGIPGAAPYSATKFGLAGLSDSLAIELGPRGVRVILVNPGPIRTASWPHGRVPSFLVLRPEQVAVAIVNAVRLGTPERTVPAYYRIASLTRAVAPPLYRAMLRRFTWRMPDPGC